MREALRFSKWRMKNETSEGLFRAEFGGCLGGPECLVVIVERAVVAVDLAILADEQRPPSIGLFLERDVAWLAVFGNRIVEVQRDDVDATMLDDEWHALSTALVCECCQSLPYFYCLMQTLLALRE